MAKIARKRLTLRTGQKQDPRTGRFLRKPGGRNSKPLPEDLKQDASLMDCLAKLVDVPRLAKKIAKQAYAGDPHSQALLLQAERLKKQAETENRLDYSLLSDPEALMLHALFTKAASKPLTTSQADLLAKLAEPPNPLLLEDEGDDQEPRSMT